MARVSKTRSKKAAKEPSENEVRDAQLRKRTAAKKDARKRAAEFAARRINDSMTWKTTNLEGGKLGIQCPHAMCGEKATVNKKKWIMCDTDYRSRGCTYCYRIGFIPFDLLPKGDIRLLDRN